MSDAVQTTSSEDPSVIGSNEDQNKVETNVEGHKRDIITVTDEQNSPTAPDVGDESLQDACKTMFKKISEYLQSELSASLEDYELLEKLNELTKQKYTEMDNVTNSLIGRMAVINEKYANLQPFLEMIEKVDASVTNLEQAAYKLDAYSKELEARFKKLEKTAS